MVLPNLKLYKNEEFEGYDATELDKWMKDRGFGPSWMAYSNGSTGGMIEGKFIVYKWDVERFLDGKPNLD